MPHTRKTKKSRWKKALKLTLLLLVGGPIVVGLALIGILYWQQDKIVQHAIHMANKDFKGRIEIGGSHISPFANFPYLSIDLEDFRIYPDKDVQSAAIVSVTDAYIGFDLPTLIQGKFEIKALKIKDGIIDIVQDTSGALNIVQAFESTRKSTDTTGTESELHLELKKISMVNIDISAHHQQDQIWMDALISEGTFKFKTSEDHLMIGIDGSFIFNVVDGEDTTYIKNKHFGIHTQLDYLKKEKIVKVEPSEIILEKASYRMRGSIDLDSDMDMDLEFHGSKSDFDLLIAFAPEELIPVLRRYENKGKVYFDASIKGKASYGKMPLIEASFGCEDAYFTNSINHKKIEALQFKGHFTNGEERSLSTMELSLTDFSAKPEAGNFTGNILVRNFVTPEIDMEISSDFDLGFLSEFLDLKELRNLTGQVKLTMRFHDIIDLEHPERSLEKINQAYFSSLEVNNLGFTAPGFHLPVKNVSIKAEMKGQEAEISHFRANIGNSDIQIKGYISDLPAIIHHTDQPVDVRLAIRSDLLDIENLTKKPEKPDRFVNEKIENFSVDFSFKSSARALTESPHLPVGEFFIDNLYAKFKHYPHVLHDFHADIFIDENNFRVIDFSGEIDKSDFHFSGKLENYSLWFAKKPSGDTRIEFDLVSGLLKLEDLFSYNGANYIPEDYRHEEFSQFKLHGHADLHFKDTLHSADIYLDKLNAKMQLHPLKLENFKGRVHVEDEHIIVENFYGKLGHSSLTANLNYYYGKNPAIRKRDNYLSVKSPRLDMDELLNFTMPKKNEKTDHDKGFNIYTLPFTDMRFDIDIGLLNYHKYKLSNLKTRLRTQANHYLYIDDLFVNIAGGSISGKGYFNGSNSKAIYLSPEFTFDHLDIDQLMIKFDNFGQDELVSDNLHGSISGKITGKIHVHNDLVPIINDSEIHLDFKVLNGRLENYAPILAVSDFFKDKNLNRIAFDTLQNKIDLTNGKITIPAMTINTTLGFIEISGSQTLDMQMDYYIRIPFKLVTSVAASKLFGRRKEDIDPEREDEIIYRDPRKKTAFVNLRISGTPDNYKISLKKNKNP